MSTYGRHVELRQSPLPQHRLGRYKVGASDILQYAPVKVVGDPDVDGRLTLELCTGATQPKLTRHGLVCWEQVYEGWQGRDMIMERFSDLDMAKAGKPCQLVHGPEVRIAYRNLSAVDFLNGLNTYAARTVVAGLGATPSLVGGEWLTPGVGNDTDGYWAETSVEAEAWLVVTHVRLDEQIVEAEMLF